MCQIRGVGHLAVGASGHEEFGYMLQMVLYRPCLYHVPGPSWITGMDVLEDPSRGRPMPNDLRESKWFRTYVSVIEFDC